MSILAIIVLVIAVLALGFVAGLVCGVHATERAVATVDARMAEEARIARLERAGRILALSYAEVRDADCGCTDTRSLAAGYTCPVGHTY